MSDLAWPMADAIRMPSIDAVERASSGHPGVDSAPPAGAGAIG